MLTYDDVPLLPSERIARFARNQLVHLKGPLGGQPLILDEWQMRDFVRPIFDNLNEDGHRIIREVFGFLPRKNGKTTLLVVICLYQLFCEKEQGPEIISAAMDLDQASKSFDIAKEMIRRNRYLSSKCRVVDSKRLIEHRRGGWWRVIPGDAKGALGDNLSTVILDELLTQKDRSLYSALLTGTSARTQPLMMCITTSGFSKESFCYQQYDYAKKVKNGTVKNKSFHPVIYEADEKDDPHKESTWRKANPGYGITVQKSYFEDLSAKAKDDGGALLELLRYHLNRWMTGGIKWLNPFKWAACRGTFAAPDKAPVMLGLDLATRKDLCGLSMAFPQADGRIGLRAIGWTNQGAIETRYKEKAFQFDQFVRQGHLIACDGWEVDYDSILKKIEEIKKKYSIKMVAADPYNAGHIIQILEQQGIKVVEYPQQFVHMNLPTKEFQIKVLGQKIIHEENPALDWCMDNIHILKNVNKEERPSKKHSPEAIDLGVSSILAVAAVDKWKREQGNSPYSQRGVRSVEVRR